MAPSRRNKKAVSVTYIPDRSKAVDMGKRFTLKKRRTTIRPITFDVSIAENDSSTLVSQNSARDIPGSQPEFVMDNKSRLSTLNQNAEADSPLDHSKDQVEGNKHKNGDQTQATPGHQSSMGNVGHQSSIVNVGHQSVAALLDKAGHPSSINKSKRHESQTMKTRHKSATLEAGRQSPSFKAGSQSVGHQSSVHQTVEDRSTAIDAISRSPNVGAGHRSRTAEAESQSVRHQTAAELDSVPGNREGLQPSSNSSMVQTSRKFLAGAQQQPSKSNIAQEQARLQPGLGKENNVDCDTVVKSDRTKDTENTDHVELPGQSSHHLRSSRPLAETKVLSSMKSALKRTKRGVCNVTVDRVTSSSHPTMQPLSDKPDTGLKVATSHALENGPLPKDANVAATSCIPSGDNLSDIFRAPMPVKGSIYSRPMSTAHTPCDTPMRPPNISSMPVAASTSQSFDIAPVNGQASGVNLGPDGNHVTRGVQAKRRQILRPTADDDQPLQDIVITVKRSSSSSSDEDHTTGRPTVSNLSELTVLMSAMEDTIERFINESQPNSRIKRFLHDVTEDTFAELRRASQASHSINKVNKTLFKGQNVLRTKRKKLLQLQQERNRLEVEVVAAKKEMSGTANRDKINDYLLKLSRLTSGTS